MGKIIPITIAWFLVTLTSTTAAKPEMRSSSRSDSNPTTLTVFAAASLTESFSESATSFEAVHPEIKVLLHFAGSQTLRAQLELGAVADVFASANPIQMNAAIAAGVVNPSATRIFTTNRLVVILPADNPARIQKLEDLGRKRLKLALAADEVPVGHYTRCMLKNLEKQLGAGFLDRVLKNLVSNDQTVKQVVAKVKLGEVDAGVAYLSDTAAAPDLQTLVVPDEFNVVAEYPIAILKTAPHPEQAAAFVDFVLSTDGQAILGKWRFTSLFSEAR